uniref:AAA-ATPase-like domain-containing protein n=1 Tax=Ditylenchus dipsaci TaxID=166011 RepID=A0A915DGL4_9BILA
MMESLLSRLPDENGVPYSTEKLKNITSTDEATGEHYLDSGDRRTVDQFQARELFMKSAKPKFLQGNKEELMTAELGKHVVLFMDLHPATSPLEHFSERVYGSEMTRLYQQYGFLKDIFEKEEANEHSLAKRRKIKGRLKQWKDNENYHRDSQSIKFLLEMLSVHYQQKPLLIIDNYDAALLQAHFSEESDKTISQLKIFIKGMIKAAMACAQVIMAGRTQLSGLPIKSRSTSGFKVHTRLKYDEYTKYFGIKEKNFVAICGEMGVYQTYVQAARDWLDGYTVRRTARAGSSTSTQSSSKLLRLYNPKHVLLFLHNFKHYCGSPAKESIDVESTEEMAEKLFSIEEEMHGDTGALSPLHMIFKHLVTIGDIFDISKGDAMPLHTVLSDVQMSNLCRFMRAGRPKIDTENYTIFVSYLVHLGVLDACEKECTNSGRDTPALFDVTVPNNNQKRYLQNMVHKYYLNIFKPGYREGSTNVAEAINELRNRCLKATSRLNGQTPVKTTQAELQDQISEAAEALRKEVENFVKCFTYESLKNVPSDSPWANESSLESNERSFHGLLDSAFFSLDTFRHVGSEVSVPDVERP